MDFFAIFMYFMAQMTIFSVPNTINSRDITMKLENQKDHVIYTEVLEEEALSQFKKALEQDCVVKAALMPDAHTGYTLPIGGVVAVKDHIFPSYVGYDIGCGMCALKTPYKRDDIEPHRDNIFNAIYRAVPTGEGNHNRVDEDWDYSTLPLTGKLKRIVKEYKVLRQLCSLGGGNHFIEISHDENEDIWIVIHSGSRGIGHKVASHYMALAKMHAEKQLHDVFIRDHRDRLVEEFKEKNKVFLDKNPKSYEEALNARLEKELDDYLKTKLGRSVEGHYAFHTESQEGRDYINDMNFCLEFALENRKRMIQRVVSEMNYYVAGTKDFHIDYDEEESCGHFINRNHNHADLKDGLWIHRKGATHAEKGMLGVIPGNMRDGSFVVEGKGNEDSLCSSSHGAGRVMSRKKAHATVALDDFKESMSGITAKVTEKTKDESPFAYKNIFEVMDLQKDLVEVKYYLKPVINIKG